jgi:YrbI family 3-deoxy-D-manno-octulosonate 8-phosphate phosphatase
MVKKTKEKKINVKKISLIVYDFDGVMTDNRVLLFEDGKESVFVNRSDGLAIDAIKKLGIAQIIVSTETNPIVSVRARKLRIPYIYSVKDKKKTVERYIKKHGIINERVAFVGNDVNDKEVMLSVGLPIAPSDAHKDIRKIAKIVLNTPGGFGVIRDLLDKLV